MGGGLRGQRAHQCYAWARTKSGEQHRTRPTGGNARSLAGGGWATSGGAQSARRQAETERDQERHGREVAERAAEDTRQRAEEALQAAQALQKAKESRPAEDRAAQVTTEATAAQLRRLTEAMAARRSLSRWARLRAAWRGE